MQRCARCGAFTEAADCACGGQLFPHPVSALTVAECEEARVLIARIDSWIANSHEGSTVTRGLFLQTSRLLRRLLDMGHA